MLVATIIAKIFVIRELEPDLTENLPNYNTTLSSFGFEFITDSNGTVTFDQQESIFMEVVASFITILLIQYYRGQVPKKDVIEPVGYIHNSLWLEGY